MAIFGKTVSSFLGSGSDNKVELIISGSSFTGWETISISRSLESISGSFELQLLDKWRQTGEQWDIKPGDECKIKIGSDTIISGYIDKLDSTFDAINRSITVSGRDKSSDLVDCSIITDNSQYKNKDLLELANIFCSPFNISVTSETDIGEKFKKWDVQQGESVFENLQKMAKLRGVLIITSNDGNLKIIRPGIERADDEIVQGENLKSGDVSYDNSNRFSEYVVKGQSAGDDNINGDNAAHNKDSSQDNGVQRYRPLLLISEGSSDKKTVKNRAQWEATVRAAKSFDLTVTVAGWRQSTGKLWDINQRVKTKANFAGVNQDLLISGVTFDKNDGVGTITTINLVRPDAFKPQEIISVNNDPVEGGIFGW